MAKSIRQVVPPKAAARVPVSKSSALVVPPNGISRVVCPSSPPGKTYRPAASIILPAFSRGRVCPMASILPFFIAISPVNVSVAVTTRPFAMMVSTPMTRSPLGHRKSNIMLNCRTSGVVSAGVHSFVSTWLNDEQGGKVKFGFTIKPDMPVERIVALTRQAETAGFEYGWVFDSHVLWLEPYPLLTLMATSTTQMRLGTCVTNPAVRDLTVTASLFATLNLISHGRMQLGIGRGDSSRRVLGKKPVSWSQLEQAVKTFRDLTAGREIEYEGLPTRISWETGSPPTWIAGYGPKDLESAGGEA